MDATRTPSAATTGCAQTCLDGNGYDYGHWLWKDQAAWKAFDIFGVHEYDSQIAFAWPADVNGGVRDKEVWQTEMSGVRYWPEEGPSTDINNGVAVAGWIHSALTVGEASAWLWWWYESYYQNDNEGLAIIQGSSTVAKRYFTLGNYSKFVRPGYVAVDVVGNSNANVLLSAYKGTDGTVVVVAVNKGTAAVTVPISITGGTAPAIDDADGDVGQPTTSPPGPRSRSAAVASARCSAPPRSRRSSASNQLAVGGRRPRASPCDRKLKGVTMKTGRVRSGLFLTVRRASRRTRSQHDSHAEHQLSIGQTARIACVGRRPTRQLRRLRRRL